MTQPSTRTMIQSASRRPSRALVLIVALAAALVLSGTTRAPAAAPTILPPGSLAPTERQRMVARRVGSILERMHYSHERINDAMSERIFHLYLHFLDGERSYFLASDIAYFQRWRHSFGEMIHTGNIDPAYAIFARLRKRERQRLRYALSLLNREPNWTRNERYRFDRTHSSWPANVAAMNALWRKRVKSDELSLMLAGKTWPQATALLRKRYEHVLKRTGQWTSEDVFDELMNAYALSFDPHSSYFDPMQTEQYRIQMSLNYDGIGAQLALQHDYVTVTRIIPGGPAALAGTLKLHDRIMSVGQGTSGPLKDVVGWRLDDVVQLIRGKAGTTVRLQVLPAGSPPGSTEKVLSFVRNKVTLASDAAKASIRTIKRDGRLLKIGVIKVPAFYEDVAAANRGDPNYRSTTRDVRRLIKKLKAEGIEGLIINLRNDGGGYLPEATALTGLFIDKGPVVQLKDTSGRIDVLDDPDTGGPVYTGPLAVLVNRDSASASEIFAAAIQDYHRGVIVGQRTFGKGTVQNLVPLDRWSRRPVNGQLTVTIAKFYRITGQSTQRLGVEPNVPLPSPVDMTEVGETSLKWALPWDRIAPAPFTPWHPKGARISYRALALAEDNRAEHEPYYRWLVEEIAAEDDLHAAKSVSLNLKSRQRESKRLDREELVRDNQMRVNDGLKPLKSVADVNPTSPSNWMVAQCAQVVGDMIMGVGKTEHGHAPLLRTARTDARRVGDRRLSASGL